MIMVHVRQDGNILWGSGHSLQYLLLHISPHSSPESLKTPDSGLRRVMQHYSTEMGYSLDAGAGPARSYNNKTEAKTA